MIKRGRARVWKDQVMPYVRKVASIQVWRMAALGYDEEDLLHEAFFVYERCLKKYGTVLTPTGKLSGRFRVGINNLITDLSNDATKKGSFIDHGIILESLYGQEARHSVEAGYLQGLIREAPKEVMEVLNLCFNTPAELVEEVSSFLTKKHSQGFKCNAFLCKVLGYNKYKRNLVKETISYFS